MENNKRYQKSCGMIIFRRNADKTEYLLLFQNGSKTWSFPKGHTEAFETEFQTALREVKEETSLPVDVIKGFREEIAYPIAPGSVKKVVLFLAEAKGDVKIKEGEIDEHRWVDKQDAAELLIHNYYSEILDKAEKMILKVC